MCKGTSVTSSPIDLAPLMVHSSPVKDSSVSWPGLQGHAKVCYIATAEGWGSAEAR